MKPKTFRILFITINALFVLAVLAYLLVQQQHRNASVRQSLSTSHEKEGERIVVVPTVLRPPAVERDRRVISDPLYPPLNRTETPVFDTYRLVGYLSNHETNKDKGGNSWKLFARMKDRHQGDFYITPVDRTIDLKIPLTNEVVVGERLRDLYTIPQEMRFNSPLLNRGPYEFTEIPRSQLDNPYYM